MKRTAYTRTMRKKIRQAWLLVLVLLLQPSVIQAAEIRVAVASNFSDAIKEIAGMFEQQTGHRITLAFGSTGKHYAQIINGAPFEAFFAADVRRPKLLDEEGVARPGSRFTYAVGKVVLWSPVPDRIDTGGNGLGAGDFKYLAVANPKLAPYGKAAEQILRAQGVWDTLRTRMVRGENIGQTFQFVSSCNAELGFVAYSQIKRPGATIEGSFWEPPQSLYSPIEQQAVLLKEDPVARQFLDFVKSDAVREIIQEYGYGTS